jgi:hypothetical protein
MVYHLYPVPIEVNYPLILLAAATLLCIILCAGAFFLRRETDKVDPNETLR